MPKFDRRTLIIFTIQITEVLGFSLVLPFLPFYVQSLGATPLVVGLILSSFSLFQFFSSPILGYLSDIYGRRPLLLISQFSTFLGFLILGFANTIPLIFLSRIVDGLFGSNFTIAQAYLTDISTKKNRSKIFAITGIAFGVGFMIGPAIGGFLAQTNFMIPSLLAATISLVTIFLTYFFLPETITSKPTHLAKPKLINLDNLKKYLTNPKISSKLIQFFLFSLSNVTWTSVFAIFAGSHFGLNTAQTGASLGVLGFFSILFRGLIIPKLIDIVGDRKLLLSGVLAMFMAIFLSSFVSSFILFLPFLLLFSFGSGSARPLISASISRSVSQKQQGALLGVTNSLGSLARIIGPLLGGGLLSISYPLFGIVTSSLMLLNLAILLKKDR